MNCMSEWRGDECKKLSENSLVGSSEMTRNNLMEYVKLLDVQYLDEEGKDSAVHKDGVCCGRFIGAQS